MVRQDDYNLIKICKKSDVALIQLPERKYKLLTSQYVLEGQAASASWSLQL
jgi:hypothetical protein